MNPKKFNIITSLFLFSIVFWFSATGWCDDTCIFSVTADDVPPYIVLLLDNGAEMEQVVWASGYDANTDYTTPAVAAGSPFTNPKGYALYYKNGSNIWLSPIEVDLSYSTNSSTLGSGENFSSTGTFTVTFSDATTKSIDLPLEPSFVDGDGVQDNATQFRYATNYLNWLFYSKWLNDNGSSFASSYDGDGSDLPAISRFFFAKTAILTVASAVQNRAKLGIYNFSNDEGASSVQPLKLIWDEAAGELDSAFFNNVNNMGTVDYSPLAEGLQTIGGYYDSNSSGVPADTPVSEYCGQLFTLIVSPGISSEDAGVTGPKYLPSGLDDYDEDSAADDLTTLSITEKGTGSTLTYAIPTNLNGTTYLDDVAGYLYTNDMVGYVSGFQRVSTYTVGFMGDDTSNAFLINTSNNGNGNFALYDENDEEYGKYHKEANDPDELAEKILEAIDDIISRTTVFTAPVVPVTRTTSGDSIYLALFKPKAGNFWEGNLTRFGVGPDASGQIIIKDSADNPATYANGALKETAIPYWETQDWADPTKSNYVHNGNRNIYTLIGSYSKDDPVVDSNNAFSTTNGADWATLLDNPASGTDNLINYIRGADVFDEDEDGNTTENRSVITGDILHSEPVVVNYDTTGLSDSVIFFGANDGMLHAVKDSDGTEMGAFIPPDLLSKLKDLLEGTGHPYYVDASPKVFISGDHDNVVNDGDTVTLVFGERAGGDNYWALDVTDPTEPKYLWDIESSTSLDFGETWSEPVFAKVKTSDGDTTGTDVMIVGGGYSADDSKGNFVAIIKLADGSEVETFGSTYCVPSTVNAVEINNNVFIDKIYVGNMGGQMLRIGKFTEDDGTQMAFPKVNEYIGKWGTTTVFDASGKKIMYPPSVTLEKDFDLVFFGTGDRNDACNTGTSDSIYAVMDDHTDTTRTDSDLKDAATGIPNIPDDDEGFYLDLASGEKILAKGTVFYKVYYITSFTPGSTDPCMPGGYSRLYALDYKTGEAVIDLDGDGSEERSTIIGGGIPSKPVMVIPPKGNPRMLISVGSTNPDANSPDTPAGIVNMGPQLPPANFFYMWWRNTE